MLFNSFAYLLLFLPVVTLGYIGVLKLANRRAAQGWLLFASLFFYAYAMPSHLPILLVSIIFNWAVANRIGAHTIESRKAWLWLGLAGNIVFLGCFKYVNFFLGELGVVFNIQLTVPNLDFPLGISFFTLTQVMYLVDCHQKLNEPISLFDHASVISFFPYVSSGPIVRAGEIAPQFLEPMLADARLQLACRGIFLLALGLAKKVIFADTFATISDAGYAAIGELSCVEAWSFSLAYTLQIYFDFSGYSDMAVGSAWILGFSIPQNFNAPYTAKSISEFWQRWHISLSNFITNYLYTPILRSFSKATLKTSGVATLLAMGIAGLWHGPAWTYIVFGLLHGVALVVNQTWKKSKRKLPGAMGWLLTFLFVNAAFVVFRSPDLGSAAKMLLTMLPHGDVLSTRILETVVPFTLSVLLQPVVIGIALAFFGKSSWERVLVLKLDYLNALFIAALLVVCFIFLNSSTAKQFVYFAF